MNSRITYHIKYRQSMVPPTAWRPFFTYCKTKRNNIVVIIIISFIISIIVSEGLTDSVCIKCGTIHQSSKIESIDVFETLIL